MTSGLKNESSIKAKFSIMPDKEFTIPIKRYGNGGWYEEWYATDHAERADVEKLAQMLIDMDGSDQVIDVYIYPNILTNVKRVVDVSSSGSKELLKVNNNLKIAGQSKTYKVFEREKPTIISSPSDVTVTEGETAVFSSDADDYDSSQWYGHRNITFKVDGETGKTYSFIPVIGNSGNRYFNQYTNIAGSTSTVEATLTVLPKTHIAFNPALVDITGGFGGDWGSTITFSNSVKGDKDIDVTKLNDDPEYAYISMKPELFSHVQGIKIDNGLPAKWPHRMATINGREVLLFRTPYKLTLRKVNFEVVWSK